MTHLNRNNFGKFWSVPRKGTKYLAVSTHNKKDSIPLLVVIRDILGFVRNKKELQRVINEKHVFVNHKEIRETNYPVSLFDVISLKKSKKNYMAVLSENKKIIFEEVSDEKAEKKVFKIIGKKILGKDKVQLNLMYGRNVVFDKDVRVGDSVVFNFKDNKIEKVIAMEKGNEGFVVKGKHAGNKGKIEEIIDRGGKSLAKISVDGEKINVWVRNVIVM